VSDGERRGVLAQVDFRLARRCIERLDQHPPSTRSRAFAAFVGLWDFADEDGVIAAPAEQIIADFQITRGSWNHYRAILIEAGLIELAPQHGPRPRAITLLAPSGDAQHG
jgi:hypothetical protein